ncbi:MAG TPA: amidohydrolase family protein [Acidimicrobiia bacterium]|nr:amidohydrolase family protein [Acidimicrobiia bacterium]
MTARLVSAGDDAVVVENGKVVAIGSRALLQPGLAEDRHEIGALLAPRHDHHFHPIGYAAAVTRLSLKDAVDLADLGQRLREEAIRLGPGVALVGNRLDDESLAERRLPTRLDLDKMVADRPVLLYRYCGHIAVANSAALALAGVDSETGILRETGVQPVANVVGAQQPPLDPQAVRRALSGLASIGLGKITAIVSAGEPIWCEVPDEIETLLAVAADVPLDFEVLVIASHPQELIDAATRLDRASPNVSFLGWKEFADGSLGGHTAALYEPYDDDPSTTGTLRLDPRRALLMGRTCLALGGTVAIHAIGDLANDQVLDVLEELITAGGDPELMRIEHASVLRPETITRMARLGVTASVQPAFITSEVDWLEKRLGYRAASTYSLSALHGAGVPMVGGSDCPVESPNPWWGIAAAAGPGGLGPDRALQLFGGKLKPGDPAHLIVVDRDPHTSVDIAGTRVLSVYRDGRPITVESELEFT